MLSDVNDGHGLVELLGFAFREALSSVKKINSEFHELLTKSLLTFRARVTFSCNVGCFPAKLSKKHKALTR